MSKILKMALGLLVAAGIFACQKDEIETPPPAGTAPVVVQFGADVTIAENAGAKEIRVQFNKAASRAGTVIIEVTAGLPSAFQITPPAKNGVLELPVEKGAQYAGFSLWPTNNTVVDDDRTITFGITDVTKGFEIGAKKSLIATIVDDESPAAPAKANFSPASGSLSRNQAEGIDITIVFSELLPAAGKVALELSGGAFEERITTEPALNGNGKLELDVQAGAAAVSFAVRPVFGASWDGDKTITFAITATDGGIEKGTQLFYQLSLPGDAPVAGRPKSWESIGGGWRFREAYEYDDAGRIVKKHWEKETPAFSQGTTAYQYADNGLIEKAIYHSGREELFIQENGRIVRSETISNGVMASYSEYEYNVFGRLSAQTEYHRQPSGEYLQDFKFVYEYENNGNVTRQLTYTWQANSGEFTLHSTRTYGAYNYTIDNPFPMIEVIPGVVMQRHLPGIFHLQENGADIRYTIQYDYGFGGTLPVRRYISGGGTSEVTTYEYY
ncbi:MAG: hypothetical protein J5I94_20975 [Phaeodactylibacter sp.]|nr:hypothetical protein [Phaeodactylibacter sp.]